MSRFILKGLESGDQVVIGFDEGIGGHIFVHLNEDELQNYIDEDEDPDVKVCWSLDFPIFDREGEPDQSAVSDALLFARSFADLPDEVASILQSDCEIVWKRGLGDVRPAVRIMFDLYNRDFRDEAGFLVFVNKWIPMFARTEKTMIPAARERFKEDACRLGTFADQHGGVDAMQSFYYSIPHPGLRRMVGSAWDGLGGWRQ